MTLDVVAGETTKCRSRRYMNASERVIARTLDDNGVQDWIRDQYAVMSATFSNSLSCAPSPTRIERLASHGITHRAMMDARTVGILNGTMRRHGAHLMKNYILVLRPCRNAASLLLNGR